jgi:holo-[acyl-carrier protein] synthase
MQVLTGVDIIEVSRIKEAIENNSSFLEKIYTKKEIEYCKNRGVTAFQSYAARFAVKEAVMKIILNLDLPKAFQNLITFKNIETINLENGKPIVNFVGFSIDKIRSIDISISHTKDFAIANAVAIID